ncbi:MAG: hypothetical protein ACYCQI_00735 [Gammaproteobacteria bacterium]
MSKSRIEDPHFLEAFRYISNIFINGHGIVHIHWKQIPETDHLIADYGSLPMHDFRAEAAHKQFLLFRQALTSAHLTYNGSPIEATREAHNAPFRLYISFDAVLKKYEEDIKAATAFIAEKGANLLRECNESKTEPPAYLKKGKIEGPEDLFYCINSKEFIGF